MMFGLLLFLSLSFYAQFYLFLAMIIFSNQLVQLLLNISFLFPLLLQLRLLTLKPFLISLSKFILALFFLLQPRSLRVFSPF